MQLKFAKILKQNQLSIKKLIFYNKFKSTTSMVLLNLQITMTALLNALINTINLNLTTMNNQTYNQYQSQNMQIIKLFLIIFLKLAILKKSYQELTSKNLSPSSLNFINQVLFTEISNQTTYSLTTILISFQPILAFLLALKQMIYLLTKQELKIICHLK